MTNQPSLNINLPQIPLDSVEDYKSEPINDFPMLNWRGKCPFTNAVYSRSTEGEAYFDFAQYKRGSS